MNIQLAQSRKTLEELHFKVEGWKEWDLAGNPHMPFESTEYEIINLENARGRREKAARTLLCYLDDCILILGSSTRTNSDII